MNMLSLFLVSLLFVGQLQTKDDCEPLTIISSPSLEVNFTIDVSGTDFKVAKYLTGTLIYSTDGTISTEKPMFYVGRSAGIVSMQKQKRYSIDKIKRLPGGETNCIKKINPILIDNLPGYEIIAEGKSKSGKDQFVYQVILFSEKGYFILVGMAPEELQSNLKSFKRITMSFRRKNTEG